MIQMLVCSLTHCPEHNRPILLLENLDRRLQLAFLVPVNEADRLARTLGLTPCQCVPVFELVEKLMTHSKARVLHVVLDGTESGISATLHVGENEGGAVFSCHPADAVALAQRAGAPIYATDEALRHACPLDQPHSHEASPAEVAQWLDWVRPEDFEE